MKVLLFSGNAKVQEALIVSVRETREETLFLNLKHRLEVTGNTYIETMDIRSQLLERKQAQIDKDKEVLAAQLAYDSLVNEDSLNNNSNNHSLEPVVEYNNRQVSIALDAMHETNGTDDLPLTIQYSPSIITLRRRATFTEIKPLKNNEDDFSDEHTLLTQLMAKCNCSKLVFEVIGFMCDGQHRTLQHYLRKQPDNFKSVNVIAEVINLLHIYTGDLTQDSNLGQTYQILRSLIEMCVGNADNRQVIFDKLVVDPLNKIFQLSLADVHKECHYEETATDKCPVCIRLLDIINMKGSAAELLEVMLENTSHDTKTIAKGIGLSLDVESVLETMQLFYELQFHPLVKKNQTDDDCVRGMFRSYHTVVSLMDFEAISSINDTNDLLKKVEELKCRDSYNASIKGSHCIEIHYKGEEARPVLAKVYFPYDHHALLREEVSELVRWSVNRDSLEDKQRSLLDAMPALKKDVRHQVIHVACLIYANYSL
jgi:inositol 1,4,5-triphosphate receptor type 1